MGRVYSIARSSVCHVRALFLVGAFLLFLSWRASFLALCRALFFSAAPAHFVAQGFISFLQREAERDPRTTRADHVFDLLFPKDTRSGLSPRAFHIGRIKRLTLARCNAW